LGGLGLLAANGYSMAFCGEIYILLPERKSNKELKDEDNYGLLNNSRVLIDRHFEEINVICLHRF
jgi:hypothetical protein